MARAAFLISTGRTSTQSLAAMLGAALPRAVVEHEPLGPGHRSRAVFRRPDRFDAALAANPALARKLDEIDRHLARGTDYIDAGWPGYAWLPYLARRFGPAFRFVHLVRNPFSVAASLLTHGFFAYDAPRPFETLAAIHAGDAALAYPDVARDRDAFTPYERNLFHWLELNRFALDHHGLPGFAGLYRYEELYRARTATLPDLLAALGGPAARAAAPARVDRHRHPLERGLRRGSDPLARAVHDLARQLGYAEADLASHADPGALARAYARDGG